MTDVEKLLNRHIREMVPYSSARDEFSGSAEVYLDANESWYGGNSGPNRYPDPACRALREKIEEVLNLSADMTAVGNGSDEIIDMVMRMFTVWGRDSIMISRPTYGEYSVMASVNNLRVIDVRLDESLNLDTDSVLKSIEKEEPKIVFICSPNNPTGRTYPIEDILLIAEKNRGITVVDEAYSDFSADFKSAVPYIAENGRIIVMRTMSKAWALAGCRLGIMVADPAVIGAFMKAKAPYNVSSVSQAMAIKALNDRDNMLRIRDGIISERGRMASELIGFPFVKKVHPSDANFLLIETTDPDGIYKYLAEHSIVVRNRSREPLLSGCLRVTIGSEEENNSLLGALDEYGKKH